MHESGNGRGNQDECRIQVAKSKSFNEALNSRNDVIVLGYFADEKIFTAWNPYMMRDRFNQRQTISLYSRFSVQKKAGRERIATYRDNNGQSVISFTPEYLGLYLENLSSIHLLSDAELKKLVDQSDALNNENAVEAAHIVPHSHEMGTDEIDNGISLCALHHTAYDRSLIYFDEKWNILINESKMEYLEKVGLDTGIRKFEKLAFDKVQIPKNHVLHPNTGNIKIANQIRGIIEK